MRQQGCRQCEQLTAGDCGQHGPSILPVFNLGDEKDIEIARLRRLRAEIDDAKKALKIMSQNLDDLSRTKQEALAQVAVLLAHVTKFPNEEAGFYFDHIGGCQYPHGGRCSCGMNRWSEEWERIKENLPAEARALLDRLAMLEDGAMTNQRLVWLEDRLQRAEAAIEETKAILENAMPGFLGRATRCLAAWEEGG